MKTLRKMSSKVFSLIASKKSARILWKEDSRMRFTIKRNSSRWTEIARRHVNLKKVFLNLLSWLKTGWSCLISQLETNAIYSTCSLTTKKLSWKSMKPCSLIELQGKDRLLRKMQWIQTKRDKLPWEIVSCPTSLLRQSSITILSISQEVTKTLSQNPTQSLVRGPQTAIHQSFQWLAPLRLHPEQEIGDWVLNSAILEIS